VKNVTKYLDWKTEFSRFITQWNVFYSDITDKQIYIQVMHSLKVSRVCYSSFYQTHRMATKFFTFKSEVTMFQMNLKQTWIKENCANRQSYRNKEPKMSGFSYHKIASDQFLDNAQRWFTHIVAILENRGPVKTYSSKNMIQLWIKLIFNIHNDNDKIR
jgi:hypothetical protein